jgi:hypothetical protein
MSGKGILWVRVPPLERLALAQLSFLYRKDEEEVIADLIRQAVVRELSRGTPKESDNEDTLSEQ